MLETRIVLGADGHGWSGNIESRLFPAGEATYSWVNFGSQIAAFASFYKNNYSYIVELQNLPIEWESEYKLLFDQILSTFKFTE